MAIPFHPLPEEVFPKEARFYIKRLNAELGELFALEGVLRAPLQASRSDASIQRRAEPQVAVTKVTPSVSSVAGGSGSATVGVPALSLSTVNTAGSTTTVVSVNSSIAIFGTQQPRAVSSGSAVGTSSYAARADHVHGLTDDISNQQVGVAYNGTVIGTRKTVNFIEGSSIALTVGDSSTGNRVDVTVGFSGTVPPKGTPALGFGTAASAGNTAQYVGVGATIAIFDTTAPVTLESDFIAAVGTAQVAARRDHRHAINVISSNSPNPLGPSAQAGSGVLASADDHVHKAEVDSADMYISGTTRGTITKDVQSTPRYWRLRVQGDTSLVTGGCTLSITSGGAVSATRDAGSSGTIVIRIDDTGTVAP